MNCRDACDMADSFFRGELLAETSHGILQHLAACPSCRAENVTRRQLRDSLRAAFDRTPDLDPAPDFAERLHRQMRVAAATGPRQVPLAQRWFVFAASALLAAGLSGAIFMTKPMTSVDTLARDAIGDHWNCALKNRRIRMPVPLEEAAQRFDRGYRALLTIPPSETVTSQGLATVVDRHSCVFGTRRFGHVVLEYRQHVMSLLVTADDARSEGVLLPLDLVPQLHGAPVNGLSVASIHGAGHTILLVSDLEGRELRQLSTTLAVPLVGQLLSDLIPVSPRTMATLFPGAAFGRVVPDADD